MTDFAIAFGANLPSGELSPMENLNQALKKLCDFRSIQFRRRSRWYRSPAYPPGSGPDFVNGVAIFSGDLAAYEVLEMLHQTEGMLGREREWRWAPRVCDLDLLFADQQILPDRATCLDWIELDRGKAQTVEPPHLILPHPRLQDRAFVLGPLHEIAPDWIHPVTGLNVDEMLRRLPDVELQQLEPIEE
ncbi:MAG: 2-amino-4-hydroxy-6-hydroxymethyldihydropteridine diphosphokinase [Pseudomonadota bacterium]